MADKLSRFAHGAQQRVDRSVAKALHKRENNEGSSEDEKPKAKKGRNKKRVDEKPQSWKRDEEYPGLIVPVPAFTEPSKGGADEDIYREWKFEKRKRDFDEEREKQEELAKSRAKQHEDAVEFDDKMALLGEEKAEEPEERDVVERDFADDAIRFDYESGKVIITRPLKPSWFGDYNIFRPDDTVVLNGKRRTGTAIMQTYRERQREHRRIPHWRHCTFRPDDFVVIASPGHRNAGKSFMMRKILYEMRHCFDGGVVFTATKHNGAYHASLAIIAQ